MSDIDSTSDSPCIFCRIMEGSAPASFVYRDDSIAAFMDLHPLTPGHTLIIPAVHRSDFDRLPSGIMAQMIRKAAELGRAMLESELGCEGYNLFLANGETAGQEVFHAHLHVIPRYEDDGIAFRLPPDYPTEASRDALDRTAGLISQALDAQAAE